MPWFGGASLLHHLETVHIASDRNFSEMRFPVQLVLRPNPGVPRLCRPDGLGRPQAGRSGHGAAVGPDSSRVKSIATYDGEVARAFPPCR